MVEIALPRAYTVKYAQSLHYETMSVEELEALIQTAQQKFIKPDNTLSSHWMEICRLATFELVNR